MLFYIPKPIRIGLKEKFDILRTLSSAAEDLKRIDNTQKAAEAYKNAMNTYLDNWLVNRELGNKRGQLGDKVLEEAMSVSIAGMEGTVRIADGAVEAVRIFAGALSGVQNKFTDGTISRTKRSFKFCFFATVWIIIDTNSNVIITLIITGEIFDINW